MRFKSECSFSGATGSGRRGRRVRKPFCALQFGETPPCALMKERKEVSVTDTTRRGAGPAERAQHAGGDGASAIAAPAHVGEAQAERGATAAARRRSGAGLEGACRSGGLPYAAAHTRTQSTSIGQTCEPRIMGQLWESPCASHGKLE